MMPTKAVDGEKLYEAQYRGLRWLGERGFTPKVLPLVFPASEASAEGRFRFLDGNGQLWAVRSDFTPLVVRALSRELEHDPRPIRVSYSGEVARSAEARLTGVAEFFQLGFESFSGKQSPLEGVTLLLGLVQHLGVLPENLVLVVGRAGVAEAILRQLLEDSPDAELLELMVAKDGASICQRLGLSGDAARYLRQAIWGEEGDWVNFFGQEQVWAEYCQLRKGAERLGVNTRFELAPRMPASYYYGVFFALRGQRSRLLLATGGEYQVPLRARNLLAMGSTLSLNRVMEEASCSL